MTCGYSHLANMTHLEIHVNQRIHPGQYVIIIVLGPMRFVNIFVYHACSIHNIIVHSIVSFQVRELKQQPR